MNNNTFVHKYLNSLITNNDEVIDMTVGNGNDTFYLCHKAKHVYGFDIQEEAINRTIQRCKGFNNLTLILDNHINIDKYIKTKVKLIIFNLGYLPNSDSKIITMASDSLLAVSKALNLLDDTGYLIISFYLGHEGGLDEYYLLDRYIRNNNLLILQTYKEQKKLLEPITYIMQKKKAHY